jgi:serine/threonine-protein kinase
MLGKYELVTKLATGGMAELFLARERGLAGLERLVVIKRILPHLADDPSFIDMFLREARIIARLNHPNVVQIFELGEEDGNYFIAMEYIHGSTAREMQVLAERAGLALPVEVAISVIDQASRGLHAAHELRDLEGNALELIHRDVSPHNLMATTEGFVKVLDFGVAKASQGVEATNSGHLKGKFAYMSPEQCKGLKLDRRADVFSLGIVLWEALTDRRLFKREKDLDMMRAVVQEQPEPPSTYNSNVPEAIDRVVLNTLIKDRDKRYQSAEEMRRALIKAARQSGLAFGEDLLSEFLLKIAGNELAERQRTMQDALERALTSNERRNLIHVTGSNSRSGVDGSDALETVVERPTDSGSFSDARQSPSGSGSLPPGVHPFGDDASESSHPGSQSGSFSQPNSNDQSDLRTTATMSDREIHTGARPHEPRDRQSANSSSHARLMIAFVGVIVAVVAGIFFFPQFKQSSVGQQLFGEDKSSPILIGDPIRIGWAPIATPDVLREEIKPIQAYLEEELGRPVPMEVTDSYEELSEGLQSGEYDVGMLPPLLYVQTKKAEPKMRLLAIRQFDGATSSDALLLTRMDSNVRDLSDLDGKKFCFTDENSTTGNFLPRAYLRRQGYDPPSFIGEVVWSGNHLQVLHDLIGGKCDAAATYSGSFLTAGDFDIPVGKIRQLAITGHVPQDSVVAAPGLADSLAHELQEALLKFSPQKHAGVKTVGAILQITGFSDGDDEAFSDLRDAVAHSEKLAEQIAPSKALKDHKEKEEN